MVDRCYFTIWWATFLLAPPILATERCQDNPSYRHEGVPLRGCPWVAQTNRCNDPSFVEGRTTGDVYCPVSCNRCIDDDAPDPIEASLDSVIVDKVCYNQGGDIEVSFTNSIPQNDMDWMGIYPVSSNLQELLEPLLWLWLCGTQERVCTVDSGLLVFGDEAGGSVVQLPPGDYKAILIKGSTQAEAPYTSSAESMTFSVQPEGQPCEPTTSKRSGDSTFPNQQLEPRTAISIPVPQPTPTDNGALQPVSSSCIDDIYTNKDCYVKGETITVYFWQCQPRNDDLVGIFYDVAGGKGDKLGDNMRLWKWACGTQSCRGVVTLGAITFDDSYGGDEWPLTRRGLDGYRAHLIRFDSSNPNVSYAASNVFRVVGSAQNCQVPIAAPTPTAGGPGNNQPTTPRPPSPQPTPRPTLRAPHPTPSGMAISLPTNNNSCPRSVTSTKYCYKEGENLSFDFENCHGEKRDWIGIYSADDDPNQLSFPLLWLWTCGSQSCTYAVTTGSLTFRMYADHWPLEEGSYRAHLVRRASPQGRYSALASSVAFQVAETCRRRLGMPGEDNATS